jgi:hypothetical protein
MCAEGEADMRARSNQLQQYELFPPAGGIVLEI